MAADPGPLIPNRGLREGADARAVLAEKLEVECVCTSSSQPLGISGIHSSREASAASMGEAVCDGNWGAAPGARRAVAALGLGIGSGMANDKPGARVGVPGTGTGLGAAIALRRTSANSSRSGAWGEVRTAAALRGAQIYYNIFGLD